MAHGSIHFPFIKSQTFHVNTAHLGDRLVERGEEILEDLQGDKWVKIKGAVLKPRILFILVT